LDKINELRSGTDEIAQKLNTFDNNTFFVKNLDSIQGDERDIIIVSTTFARNEE
jgi:superfamily I DNA and/or RNA helicase